MARSDNLEKLAKLIDGIDFAMLTTAEANHELRSRPMSTQAMTDDGELLFFTRSDAPKVGEALHHPVNISYADPKANTYVSVSGTASVSTDRGEIRKYWKPQLKAWFPGGVEDPNVALLHVTVERAEYWDAPHNPIVQVLEFVKAATGAPVSFGDHAKIDARN